MAEAKRKRVLMLLQNAPYPFDSRVRREATTLTSNGIEVTLICPGIKKQRLYEIHDGVRIYRFQRPPEASGLLGYLFEYGYSIIVIFSISLFVLLRHGFDAVHAHCPPDAFVFIAAFYKILGKRFTYDHHDLSPELYNTKSGGKGNRLIYQILVLLERLSCRLADRVIATNESYKNVEMQRGGIPEERITIVRNGPDMKRMQRVESDPELRAKAKTLLGYVGVLGEQDGLDYLLRAVNHLVYEMDVKDLFCVIIGKGAMLPYLKKLALELRVDDYVWFTEYVPDEDMIRFLSTVDICVDPDPSNPFNDRCTMIKILEYMALGKPIVAFDLPEHRISAQEAAYYAKPNDETDFARQIMALTDDPKQREKMGQIGKSRIAEGLSWAHQSASLIEAYEKLFKTD
jgi:glycosyltransferase involved in cell wall biosynthesis